MKNITAIILGGGRGGRLLPLTSERAKPAVGFAGKYRLIDIPISNCINSGIERQYVLTQFHSASLHRHVTQTYRFDNFSNGFVDILAAEQTHEKSDWFQGTADAVRATFHHINYYPPEVMLVLSGDQIYRMNYQELIARHRESNADITLAVYPVPRSEAPAFGLLKADEEGRVNAFVEKPNDPALLDKCAAPSALLESLGLDADSRFCLASMGIYVFNPSVLERLLADATLTDFGKEVIPAALDQYRVMAHPFTGYWKDIGTIENYYQANTQLASESPPFKLSEPGWPIYTHSRSLPPNRIMRSRIQDSLIAEGCEITGAGIHNSVVGTRGVVGAGSRLSGVVMLGADFYESEGRARKIANHSGDRTPALGVGRDCRIERTIIDKNARIGDGVRIPPLPHIKDFRSDLYWIRNGIVVIPSGAVIPSGLDLSRHLSD